MEPQAILLSPRTEHQTAMDVLAREPEHATPNGLTRRSSKSSSPSMKPIPSPKPASPYMKPASPALRSSQDLRSSQEHHKHHHFHLPSVHHHHHQDSPGHVHHHDGEHHQDHSDHSSYPEVYAPSFRSYEPYSVHPQSAQPSNSSDPSTEQPQPFAAVPRPFPPPIDNSLWHRILYPTGVSPKDRKYEHWVGRVGFGAKGLVYSFVGGMTCATASRLSKNHPNGSPQGAFILIGDFPVGGKGLLVIMLLALACYVAWRWWECFTYQGADATFSPFKNFFAYRLSPFISGCVYIAYGYYIIEILLHNNKPTCYPECWRHTVIGRVGLVLFGVAFAIACLTQLLNTFTRKWHPEIAWRRCNFYEKWVLLVFGHCGFAGRSGLFIFVSILMFRALQGSVKQSGNTLANGINQLVGTGAGRVFMFIIGLLTLMYGVFAILCSRYRYFPTPPPSGIPLYYNYTEAEARKAELAKRVADGEVPGEGEVVREGQVVREGETGVQMQEM